MNWHSYLLLNLGVAAAYLTSRIVLHFCPRMSPSQQLRFARYALLIMVAAFLFMPTLMSWLPTTYDTTYHLEPFLRRAATTYFTVPVDRQQAVAGVTQPTMTLHLRDALWLLIAVSGVLVAAYLKNMRRLIQLTKTAYCHHRLRNVSILISEQVTVPCCWSWLTRHYLMMPAALVTKPRDMRLAIRHELQHIRQGDTYWLHGLALLSAFSFWNPFVRHWTRWLGELQEFACDEMIVTRKTVSAITYAECLLTVAADAVSVTSLPHGALGLQGLSASLLARRVHALFHYKEKAMKKITLALLYCLSFVASISIAFAFNGSNTHTPITARQIADLISASHVNPEFHLSATPEVVDEINRIRSSDKARRYMRRTLHRMQTYQPVIQAELRQNALPRELLVMPFVESGYQPLPAKINPVRAAGIWQIIPETAKQFGLTVNAERDDRLNTQRATRAAITLLMANHAQFRDWKLACIAYEIGENNTAELIAKMHSHDPDILVNAPDAPKELKSFVTQFDAALIIMHHPSLIA